MFHLTWLFKVTHRSKLFFSRTSHVKKLSASDRSNFNEKIYVSLWETSICRKAMKTWQRSSLLKMARLIALMRQAMNIFISNAYEITFTWRNYNSYFRTWIHVGLRIKQLWDCLRINAEITTLFATLIRKMSYNCDNFSTSYLFVVARTPALTWKTPVNRV